MRCGARSVVGTSTSHGVCLFRRFGNAAQKQRGRFQVPVSSGDIGMAEVGGQRQHVTVRILVGFQAFKRSYGKAVAQRVRRRAT